MVTRDELIKTVHHIIGEELIAQANRLDTNANGVQIHGTEKVTKVALGVSSTLDFYEEAVKAGAQFCIAHHGMHLDARYIYNSRLDQAQQKILKFVFQNEITASAYHYALDSHPEIGNNAVIIRELGAKRLDIPYMEEGWGWVAEFDEPQDVAKLAEKCSDVFSNDIFAVYGGPKKVKRIGVCSGGAKPTGSMLHEIYELGIELHITGEISHSGIHIAKEAGFNYFAGGHYATEVFGVQELGKKLKEHYKDKLEVEFIDIPNPL
jgi:dinuclear metal center YbgI/SA1388 family protein